MKERTGKRLPRERERVSRKKKRKKKKKTARIIAWQVQ